MAQATLCTLSGDQGFPVGMVTLGAPQSFAPGAIVEDVSSIPTQKPVASAHAVFPPKDVSRHCSLVASSLTENHRGLLSHGSNITRELIKKANSGA